MATAKKASKTSGKSKTARDVHSQYEKALSLLYKKDYEGAQKALEKIRNDFPDEIEVLARVETFLKLCQRRLEKVKTERSAEALFDLGVFLHNKGDYKGALEKFKKALESSKKHSDHIYYAMAAAEVQQGNTDEGLKLLKKAIDLNSQNRFFAGNDPDFRSLLDNEKFRKLVNPPD